MRRRRAISRAAAVLAGVAAAIPALCAEPLAVRAEPASLVLGTGAGATVAIVAPCEAPPRVTASAGRVEAPRPRGGGRFDVGYAPPPTPFPQVAIVAATSCGAWGWTAIPLAGHGLATARSAPRAEIRVRIGEAEFGPVRADGAGEARVPVVVPAGVTLAYHGDEPLDLNVPPTLHVLLALGSSVVPADATREVPLRVFAVTPSGAPRAAAPIRVEVTAGEVVDLVEVGAGELAGAWRLPPGAAGTATAVARLEDEPGLSSAASVERPAGAPARLALEADRLRAVAGVDAPVALRAVVTDAAGNPADGEPRLEAALGVLSAPRAVSPGSWEAQLALPATVRRAARAEVVARLATLEGRVAIDVVLAPPPPRPRVRRFAVSPKLGLAASPGGLAAAYLGAEGAWLPGLLRERLSLAVEVGGFARDRTDDVAVGAQPLAIRGRARYVPALASVRLHLASVARGAVWAGAGAGVAHVASEVSVGTAAVVSESGLVPVLHASTGWGLRLGRATPFAEARLAWHGDPGFEALRGSLTTLTLMLGCRYDAY